MQDQSSRRLRLGLLWVSMALVATFALFPGYVGSLAGRVTSVAVTTGPVERLVLTVEGMTCAGCEAGVEAALAKLPTVLQVTASHEDGTAVVEVEAGKAPTRLGLATAVGKAGFALVGVAEANPVPSLAGHWIADLPTDEGSARLVVDLGTLGDRWVGEFDLLEFNVENYPVEVSVSGTDVTLFFTALGVEFEGTLSANGSILSGTGKTGEEEEPIELRREAVAPLFSSGFLELEAAAEDPSRVERLSGDGAELRLRFNSDHDKTRLLMLLSPT